MQILPRLLGAISNSVWVEAIVASRRCFEPAQISRNCYVKTLVFKSGAFYACQDVATKSHEKSLEETGPYLQIILSQHDRPRELQRRTVNNATREKRLLYLVSDFGLVFFCLCADLPGPTNSLFRVSADSPLLDCSSILCLSYSRLSTSDREGGGWNVTGALIGPGSCFSSCLLLLRRVEVESLVSAIKIYCIFDEFWVTINKTVETLLRPFCNEAPGMWKTCFLYRGLVP